MDPDWLLALLVDHLNEHGGEIPITLTTPGGVLTGTLIGVREYLKRYGTDLASVFPSRANAILDTFDAAGEESANSVRRHKEKVRAGETEFESPRYLHLRDAQYLTGNLHSTARDTVLWRGRLVDVSGFSLGIVEDV